MNDNFLITINNLNVDFTNSNIYFNWCEKNQLEKISNEIDEYYYIPCFFSSKSDRLTELVKNGYIFLFIKNPKVLYGFIKVESVLIKNIPEKNYLEDDEDDEDDKKLTTNDKISINSDNYQSIIKKNKIVEIPKIFLVKFKHLHQFKYEIGINKFNTFALEHLTLNQNSNSNELKYPKKVQNCETSKCNNKNFITNLNKYMIHLNNKDKIIIDGNTDTSELSSLSQISNDENDSKLILKSTRFCIPVLWNCCEIVKKALIYQTAKANKNLILEHYYNCTECEIVDNNDIPINLKNKKIVIKNINENIHLHVFDSLIDEYKNINNLKIDVENIYKFDKNKINIIACSKSKKVYSKCLFIIE